MSNFVKTENPMKPADASPNYVLNRELQQLEMECEKEQKQLKLQEFTEERRILRETEEKKTLLDGEKVMERALSEQLKETMDYLEQAKREEAAPLIEEIEFYEQGEVLSHETDLKEKKSLSMVKTSPHVNDQGSFPQSEKFSFDKSGTITDEKEGEAVTLSSENFQNSSQDGASTHSLATVPVDKPVEPSGVVCSGFYGLTIEQEEQAKRYIKILSNPSLREEEKTRFSKESLALPKPVIQKIELGLKTILWEKQELLWKQKIKRKKEERKEKQRIEDEKKQRSQNQKRKKN